RAYLQAGIISDQFLPLDGVIYGQYVREKLGPKDITLPNEVTLPKDLDIQLPFRKAMMRSDAWFYKCSFAQWSDDMIEDQQAYSKKFDLARSDIVDFGGRAQKVYRKRGKYKAYRVKVYYRHASYVEWYADGDKEDLLKILPFCT